MPSTCISICPVITSVFRSRTCSPRRSARYSPARPKFEADTCTPTTNPDWASTLMSGWQRSSRTRERGAAGATIAGWMARSYGHRGLLQIFDTDLRIDYFRQLVETKISFRTTECLAVEAGPGRKEESIQSITD